MDLKVFTGILLLMADIICLNQGCEWGYYFNGTCCVHCSHEEFVDSEMSSEFLHYRYRERCSANCSRGYYGPHCSERCSDNCKLNSCYRWTGKCTSGCNSDNWYGESCNKSCSPGCLKSTCYYNGTCKIGCHPGYNGRTCIRCPQCAECNSQYYGKHCQCEDGWWGFYCQHQCPKNCQKCQNNTPVCTNCTNHRYGSNCSKICSEGCLGQDCDMTGVCKQGCLHGLMGETCENCANHRYGSNCSETCSEGCVGQDCDMTGVCRQGCVHGWIGKACQVSVLWFMLPGGLATVVLTVCFTVWLRSRRLSMCCIPDGSYLQPQQGDIESTGNRQLDSAAHIYDSIPNVEHIQMEGLAERRENDRYPAIRH